MRSFLLQIAAHGAVALSAAAPVFAHPGSRVWVGNVNGTITTFASDNDINPTTFTPSQVFTTSFEDQFGVFSTEFPGYEVKSIDGQVAPGTVFGFRLAGPALVLDMNQLRETSLSFPPPAPQLAVSLGSSFRITSSAPQDGFDFFSHNVTGDHSHLSYTFLGDGTSPATGPDGVYVLPMMLTSSSLLRSDWYFIVLGKNAPAQRIAEAKLVAETMSDALPGDANFDLRVDIADFAVLASNFNTSARWWRYGDFDFNGTVDIGDFALLAGNFNQVSPRTAIPEPAAGLFGIAALLLRRRR